jgi:CDP-diacylglycerol--glycerol-3-phosphate 3-phosphatidyltransferase
MNIPNYLTYARIALIPVFALIYLLPFSWSHWLAAILFALAAITDWLDGFLARSLNQESRLGAFLDPVADKIMVAVVLVLLVAQPYITYIALPAAIIICREIIISALREWMAEVGKRTSVAVSFIGKVKTFAQMLALLLLISYVPSGPMWLLVGGMLLLYLAVILTLWSMVLYLKAAWKDLTV